MTTQVTKKVNGTDFLAPKHHIKTHSHAQEVKALRGNWWLKWLGMTDWRLSQLHASCPRPYPPSAALPLPLQPSFDRKQEATRLVSVLSCVRLMTPTALCWQPRNRKNTQQHKKGAFWLFFFIPFLNRAPLLCHVWYHTGSRIAMRWP